MSWNADRIELVLGLVLALTGAAGMFTAYGRSSPSVAAHAIRAADLLTFFAITVLGVAFGTQGLPSWVHIGVLCVAIACMGSAVVIRRGVVVPAAT